MARIDFNATGVQPTELYEAIPAGWYNVIVDQSEMKPAKAEGNWYLEVRLNILDGQYTGRKLFTRMNLRNQNPKAQEIAYRELAGLCQAAGRMQVGDSAELHNIPLKVKVKVKPAQGEYEASNEIQVFANINTQTGPVAGPAGAAPWAAAGGAVTPPPAAPVQQWQAPAPAAPAPAYAPQPQAPAYAPQAAPAAYAPPPAYAPPAAPQQAPQAAWTPPPAAQPWAAAPAPQAPQQAPQAPQAAPVQADPAAAAAQGANPPWMTQVAPGAAPVAGAAPPWATPQA